MNPYDEFYELIFDYLKRIAFPGEWLAVDITMSKQELFTMMILERMKEATMSQLADQLNFPMSTATGIVDRLVKKGYMERGRNDADRRVVVTILTEKGKEFVAKIKTLVFTYAQRAYEALDEEERETAFRIIEKVIASVQKYNEDTRQSNTEKSKVRKITIE
jgi:DNA-binding MarR family transcriptional regulator